MRGSRTIRRRARAKGSHLNTISRRQFSKAAVALGAAAAAGVFGAPFAAAADTLNFQSVWLNDPEFLG